jgi:glycolate oxidase iron-sulfur subunit
MSALVSETQRRSLPIAPAAPPAPALDYELFLDCVHCGLCTSACPTYLELGEENDSPRGRIYLMRAVTDGRLPLTPQVRQHLDRCLDCRACESACPSGVRYSRLIEPFRLQLAQQEGSTDSLGWLERCLLFHLTPFRWRLRWALAPARWLQRSGLQALLEKSGLFRLLPPAVQRFQELLPQPLARHYGRLPEVLPAQGPRRARVALFVGCAADVLFPNTTLATVRVLQHNGCEVWLPRRQGCCGALHYHAARAAPARALARRNCQAFAPGLEDPVNALDAIITNAAGCGAMLKDYGHLLAQTPQAELARRFAAKVQDISEFLVALGPRPPAHPLSLTATYHDACHLCHGQQIRRPPRQLLELIPGLKLVPLPESEVCCGAAGSYHLTQPAMAERLGRRKVEHILSTGAQAVFTGNVGCLLQIQRHLRRQGVALWTAHPVDVLWASYSGERPPLPDNPRTI